MTHTMRSHYFHLIWSTKNRDNLIAREWQDRLYSYMAGILKNFDGQALQIGGIANHVHLLVTIKNLDHYSEIIRSVKADSSRWVNAELRPNRRFSWQEGYGSFSVSHSQIDGVIRYIQNQEEHHRTMTFDKEYIRLLELNAISYDERFVLG